MYSITKTDDGYMVYRTQDPYEGEYVHDAYGDNLFDSEREAEKLLLIERMRDAIDNIFEAIEEGDAETIVHLALRYKQLFGTKEMSK